jgi:hypothetical protein
MAGDDRTWFRTFSLNQSTKARGKMYTFDIEAETFQNLELIDYPYEHFHPLGVDLLKGKNHQVR